MAVEFYRYSFDTAKRDDQIELYKKSAEENRRLVSSMEDENTGFHAKAYNDGHVDDGYIREIIGEFGRERTMFVLASNVKLHINDPRIDDAIKTWAKSFNAGLKEKESLSEVALNGFHTGIINILAKQAINEQKKLNLFTGEHCDKEIQSYEDQVIIINPKYLKEQYWSPENQLWLATDGFGCQPDKIGRALYATCLFDGDKARWERHQVLGVIKDECMPQWAREKLQELNPQEETEEQEMNFN